MKNFIHPRVLLFIFLGTAIIFLTFLTDNNAVEIVISALASIFIGIGINNLTSLETRNKDEMIIQRKTQHALQVLNMIEFKIRQTMIDTQNGEWNKRKTNYDELVSMVELLRNLLIDEETLL